MASKTQAERDARRLEKNAYLERKQKLQEVEEKNYDRIILMKATGNFWGFYGHSAVILAFKVAPALKNMRVAIKRDTDFDYKFHEGMIAVQNIGFYVNALKACPLIKSVRKTETEYRFLLAEKISEEEYKLLVRTPELKQAKLQSMVVKSHPMPQVNVKAEEVMKTAARLYRKYNDPVGRELMTRRLFEQTRVAHKMVLTIARGEMDKKLGLDKVAMTLSQALADVMQIAILEYWSVGDCTALSAQIIAAMNAIEVEKKTHPTIKSREAIGQNG